MASLAPILQMMMAQQQQATQILVAAMQNRSNPVEDLARLTALTGATDDRMTTKDFLTMLPTIKDMIAPNQGKSTMAEALETMRSVKLLEREFGGGQETGAASSFWDFLKEFVTSDAGANIAAAITAQEGAKKVEDRQQQRRAIAANAGQLPQQTQEQHQPAPEERLAIPESFREKYAIPINTASTPQERLEALVRSFQHLGAYPEFRPYMAKIIGLMKENRKIECLSFISDFLSAMIEAGALEQEACEKALLDLETYWLLVRQQLKMPDIPEVVPEGYDEEENEAEEPEEDEPENAEREIEPPRNARRNPERDVVPLDPTPEQMAARQALAESLT